MYDNEDHVMELKKTDDLQIISPEKLEENAQGIFYIHGNFRTFYREGKKIGEVFFGIFLKIEENSKKYKIFRGVWVL